jgi:hypothetical protein
MKATNNKSNADELALKDAVKTALDSYDSTVILQMLIQQGYDPFYAQGLIEEAEEDSDVITAKDKKSEVIPDESEEDLKRQQAQQEEDALADSKQQALLEQQQQAADDDADDDEFQDLAEQQYFNFAKGGPKDPIKTWSEKYKRMLTPEELAWLDKKFNDAQAVTDLYKAGNKGVAEKARVEYNKTYGDSFSCPNGQCDIPVGEGPPGKIQIGETEIQNRDEKTGEITTKIEPLYEDLEERLPIRYPEPIDNKLGKFVGELPEEEEIPEEFMPEEMIDETETEESYPEQTRRGFDPNFYIDLHGHRLDYRERNFRKPGHSGDLIKKGKTKHLYFPSIERGPSTSFMIKGQKGIAVQTPSFYDYAMSEMQRFLAMPEAWKGDPDFENADGTFNLCIDCLNPNYENEQDLRDMNRLIEEGFTREIPHYGKDQYMQGLTKYGIPMPIPGAKKVPQNAYGGLYKANYGVDVNPMPNAQYSQGEEQPFITWPTMEGDLMRDGGIPNKRSFLKKMTNHLMKANMGMEQQSQMPSPYGNVDNPTGNDISGKQNFVSTLNKQAQMFQAKQQAEQMYNNMYGMMSEGGDTNTFGPPLDQHDPMEHLNIYGQSLGREFQDPTSMETFDQKQFGGAKNRRIKRANRALFGVPMMPPGTSVDYEFGPLGGLRRASAETDLTQLAELLKLLPGSPNANPLVTLPDLISQMGYRLKVNQGRLVEDEIADINNQSLKEVATLTGNETAETKAAETPTINTSDIIPKSENKSYVKPNPGNNQGSGTGRTVKPPVVTNPKVTVVDTKNNSGLPKIGKRVEEKEPDLRKKGSKAAAYYQIGKTLLQASGQRLPWFMEEGGFVDSENPDLYRFIYGGDDVSIPYINNTDMYRNGGRILPEAAPGMESFDQFRLQKMNPDGTLKNKPSLPGGEELMGNPYNRPQQQPVQPSVIPNQPQGQPQPQPQPQGQGQFSPQQMQQMQQYMQMMQQMGQQTPFAFGAPRGLGLGRAALKGLTGFSRDFNYMTGDNPGNWSIPEGMTNLRKETFKDRGKKFNPFDTKRVTTYEYSKPGEPAAPGSSVIPPTIARPKESQTTNSIPAFATPGASLQSMMGLEPNKSTQVPNSPLINPTNPNAPLPEPEEMSRRQMRREYMDQFPRSNVSGLEDESRVSVRAGERGQRRDARRAFRQDPNSLYEGPVQPGQTAPMSDADYMARVNANKVAANNANSGNALPFGYPEPQVLNRSRAIDENITVGENPLDYMGSQLSTSGTPVQRYTGEEDIYTSPSVVSNMSGPMNEYYGGGSLYAEGGYIPDYYTFDGYLPMANNGIVSDTPDFQMTQDPNSVKYRIEEQSGFSFDPNKLGNTLGVGSNIASSVLEDLQSVGAQRFGSNKQNYSRDIDRQLAYRGVTDQEGIDKKAGFESGRTYTGKYGGQYKDGGQYKNGGTYSLTREQIDQIRKMGGDVEFI